MRQSERINTRLRIVLAASEAVPFSKTGGLADVSGALARSLDALGHDVVLIVPDYLPLRQSQRGLPAVHSTGVDVTIEMHGRPVRAEINWALLPGTGVRVLLVRQPEYFDRAQPYGNGNGGYADNCERFCFFSRAVPEICRRLVLRPDVIHCNDWQTGLIPALVHSQYAGTPGFERTATVMTIHNMAYQGRFWHLDMPLTGMDWRYFNHHQLEAWGELNLLKAGIAFADQVTTVSPTYAEEICTGEGGYGLDGLLRYRRDDLTGILNGIDAAVWNPETDACLPRGYSAATHREGKAVCRRYLQQRMKLPISESTPVVGMVSRMVDQKGFDLVMGAADRLLRRNIQLVFLGTGDPHYEHQLRGMAERYPGQVAARIGFDESLAHQIEAGADIFLMPSRFEPCGLNQMYSLRYGTVPVVRRVGGLADSVRHFNGQPDSLQTADGFVFSDYSVEAFGDTVERALDVWGDRTIWERLVRNGMGRDWSWEGSAGHYVEVYRRAAERISGRRSEGRV
ncbi:MAG: glycogen synthase GlgA [Planctomycetaceae bacterium]